MQAVFDDFRPNRRDLGRLIPPRLRIFAGDRLDSIMRSFGVAEGRPGEMVEDVFARADVALYAAKRGGRNRVEAG